MTCYFLKIMTTQLNLFTLFFLTESVHSMKITHVRTIVIDAHRTNWVLVKIETDAGISGIGEATVERREQAVVQTVEAIANYLVGKDPFPVEHHARTITRDSYWRTGVINRSALSGIEAALWDIKGKALGVPVYELLGGKSRDRVAVYGNNWSPAQGIQGASCFIEALQKPLDLGFKALKWGPFGKTWLQMAKVEKNAAIDEIAAARRHAGCDIDLMIEGHGRLDLPTAIEVGNRMAEFDPLFFEEPTPPDNLNVLAEVKARSSVPIAGGERYMDRFRFAEVARLDALDWWQPDVCHVGGLAEMKAVAVLAETQFRPIAPHNPMGPVGNAMNLQLAAVIPNFALLETMVNDVPWRGEVVQENVTIENGHMLISDAPGLGIEVDFEAAARYPYVFKTPAHFREREPWPEGTGPWFKIRHAGSE